MLYNSVRNPKPHLYRVAAVDPETGQDRYAHYYAARNPDDAIAAATPYLQGLRFVVCERVQPSDVRCPTCFARVVALDNDAGEALAACPECVATAPGIPIGEGLSAAQATENLIAAWGRR